MGNYIQKVGFSTFNQDYYKIEFLEANPFVQLKFEDTEIATQLFGSYNFTNCAIAVLMGKYFNVEKSAIKTALESYVPSNNRSQIIEKNGHKIILDAYNANPTSMKAALDNFSMMNAERKIVFLGDMFELGESAPEEHQNIAQVVEQMNFEQSFLIGENFHKSRTQIKQWRSFDDLSKHWINIKLPQNSLILIKGSRGMALERILDLI